MKKICYFVLPLLIFVGCNLGYESLSKNGDDQFSRKKLSDSSGTMIVAADVTLNAETLDDGGIIVLEELDIGGQRFLKITVPDNINVSLISQIPGIKYAEEEHEYHVHLVPSDPMYEEYQYSAQATGLEPVWDIYTGSGITVAVVDSGINTLHEDFGGASTFIPGYNTISEGTITTTENSDDNGHGTHVAGIIGARQNSLGISGAAPEATLMPVKVMDSEGNGNAFDIAQGITWATDNGADVINLSLGGVGLTYIVNEAVNYALSSGVVVVVSSGNDSHQKINYPAALHGVITVGATNGKNEVADFSTRGSYLNIVAPGEVIMSLSHERDDGYLNMNGTSMAAPFVSAIAALLLEEEPTATPAQIKAILESSASDIGDAGFDNDSGYGLVNPSQAIAADLPVISTGTLEVSSTYKSNPVGEVLFYLKDNTDTIVTAGLTNKNGSLSIPDLPVGDYTVECLYYGESQETGVVSVASGATASTTVNFSIDLLTFNTGPSGVMTNGVDPLLFIVEDNGVDQPTVILAVDDTAESLYPSVRFPVQSGVDYYVGFDFSQYTLDDYGYLSLMYTLGPSLDFSGDSNSNRVDLVGGLEEAQSSANIVPDTSYYIFVNDGYNNGGILYLDFTL